MRWGEPRRAEAREGIIKLNCMCLCTSVRCWCWCTCAWTVWVCVWMPLLLHLPPRLSSAERALVRLFKLSFHLNNIWLIVLFSSSRFSGPNYSDGSHFITWTEQNTNNLSFVNVWLTIIARGPIEVEGERVAPSRSSRPSTNQRAHESVISKIHNVLSHLIIFSGSIHRVNNALDDK